MALNETQRQTLRMLVDVAVDGIIDQATIPWLKKCILPVGIQQAELRNAFNQEYLDSIHESYSVPFDIRHAWRQLDPWILGETEVCPHDALQLLQQHPNFNPYHLADLQRFETQFNETNLEDDQKLFLLRLRELYLEMTPMDDYQYGEFYTTFHYRLGKAPLSGLGELPKPGEIRQDIEDMVEKRIELFEEAAEALEKVQKETDEQLQQKEQQLEALYEREVELNQEKELIQLELEKQEEAMTEESKRLLEQLEAQKNELEAEQQKLQDELTQQQKQYGVDKDAWEQQRREREEALIQAKNQTSIQERLNYLEETLKKQKQYDMLSEETLKDEDAETLEQNGDDADDLKNYGVALQCYRYATDKGSAAAPTRLGVLILMGLFGKIDKFLVRDLFQTAAERKHPRGMYNLAMMLEHGDGVPKHLQQALVLYEAYLAMNPDDTYTKSRVTKVQRKIENNRTYRSMIFTKTQKKVIPSKKPVPMKSNLASLR